MDDPWSGAGPVGTLIEHVSSIAYMGHGQYGWETAPAHHLQGPELEGTIADEFFLFKAMAKGAIFLNSRFALWDSTHIG